MARKLADVVQGRADAALLDTYGSERFAHVREFIELAVRLGGLIMSLRPGMIDPAYPQQLKTPRPRLGPGAWEQSSSRAGRLAPQPVLADGRRLDDVTGYRTAALVHPDAPPEAGATGDVRADGAMVVRDAGLREWLDTIGAQTVVLRPDRYVRAFERTVAMAAS